MKLNLGCGDERREGWVNVDLRFDIADVVADVRHLPFADSSADEMLAQDILEHFSVDETLSILREWGRVLIPEGFLTLRVPNMHKLAQGIVEHWGDP
ncbi:MAG: class I SAM-dependent methyltransferase, partial [Candidatus Methylomirabilales bacterium]